MKRKILLTLSLIASLSLVGCGGDEQDSGTTVNSNNTTVHNSNTETKETEEKTTVEETTEPKTEGTKYKFSFKSDNNSILFANDKSVSEGELDYQLDPKEVYANLEYIPEMFYGSYDAAYKSADDYLANTEYFDYTAYYAFDTSASFTTSITDIPYSIECGHEDIHQAISQIDGYNWARLLFMEEEDNSQYTIYASYTIKDNTITFTPVPHYNREVVH